MEVQVELSAAVERLNMAAETMERMAARLMERQTSIVAEAEANVREIVATVATAREEELERTLAAAEARLNELQASAGAGRKTAGVGRMVAKDGGDPAVALDGVLHSLTVEQRIAVKAELLRAGLV